MAVAHGAPEGWPGAAAGEPSRTPHPTARRMSRLARGYGGRARRVGRSPHRDLGRRMPAWCGEPRDGCKVNAGPGDLASGLSRVIAF